MVTTTKLDLAIAVQNVASTSRQLSIVIVDTVLETVSQQLEQGESVKLSGFGVFSVRPKRARRGRNPKTGEQIEVSARNIVSFRSSIIIRKRVATPP